MKQVSLLLVVFTALLALSVPATVFAQNSNRTSENTAIVPAAKGEWWMKRHEEFLKEAKKGDINLLFLGDSITDFWRNRGSNIWNEFYAPRHAANFGISGDRTQNVLWRVNHGELDGIHPKVVVLMIGTNNTGKEHDGITPRNSTPEVIAGIQAVVRDVRAKLPDSKILLLAIFPRGTLMDPQRAQVALINSVIAKLGDEPNITYLDIGYKFLESDGTLPRSVMPHLLHPNEKGYRIWAEAMEPTLSQMLK